MISSGLDNCGNQAGQKTQTTLLRIGMKEIVMEQVAVQGAAEGHYRSTGSALPTAEEPPKGLKGGAW